MAWLYIDESIKRFSCRDIYKSFVVRFLNCKRLAIDLSSDFFPGSFAWLVSYYARAQASK